MSMPSWDPNKDAALKIAWAVYRTWAKTSRSTAQQLRRSRWYILLLAIVGALLSTAAQFVHSTPNPAELISVIHRGLASLGALAIAFGAYLTRELLSEEAQRKWLRSRAAAEGAKSETFLFRLGCSPYDRDDAIQKLLDTLKSQQKLVAGITHDVISEAELVERLPAGSLAIEDYVKVRVNDQIGWYNERIEAYLKYMGLTRKITILLGGVSVVLSVVALKNVGTQLIPLVATLTVVLGSAVTAAQYGYLITSYQATADQLGELKQEWSLSTNPASTDAISNLATKCESAISAENSAWMAKLSEKIPQAEREPIVPPANIINPAG
jgi:hypothetical protein